MAVSEAAEGRRRGLHWWSLWLLLGLALGMQAVRLRLAEGAVQNGNSALAAAVRPQNGRARALVAQGLYARGEAQAAQAESIAALQRTPLAVVAVRTLAMSRDKLQGGGAGEQAWQVAAAMGWRDKQTQLWAVLRALSNGEAEIVAMRGDALLRAGDPNGAMSAMIRQFLREPAIRAAFIRRLETRPEWRGPFFATTGSLKPEELEGLVATLRDLRRSKAPPTRNEVRGAIDALISHGRFRDAVVLDAMFVLPRRTASSLIDDGGFDRPDSFYRTEATPFDWTILIVDTASANLDESENRSMTIGASGGGQQIALRRFVALPSGSYRLAFDMRGPPQSPRAVGIRLFCAGQPKPIAESPRIPIRTEHWEPRQIEFEVPDGCPLMMIGLGSIDPEASGEAQFDNFVLQPIAAGSR